MVRVSLQITDHPLHTNSTSLFYITFLNPSTAPFLSKPSDLLSRAAWQHPGASARHCRSTSMRMQPADHPRGFKQECNEKKSSTRTGSSKKDRRRAVRQLNLHVRRISGQFLREAQCCSKTSPSWLPSPHAPSPSKQRTQPAEGSPCGIG